MAIRADNFDYIRRVLQQRSAIALTENKRYLVESRLSLVARKSGLGSVDELVDRLRATSEGPLWHEVVDAMTTNETSFFRDQTPFHILRETVFTQLLERRGRERTLRVWSAACASGQEAYSLAMLWHEFCAESPGWELKLLATDISNEMLDRARAGRFTPVEVNRGLTEEQRVKYFRNEGDDWRIDDALRSMVEFRQLNLINTLPTLPQMDVILLRNVLVYFDLPTKQDILSKLRRVLRPDGYLFLGGAETTLMIDDSFERARANGGSFYRLKNRE